MIFLLNSQIFEFGELKKNVYFMYYVFMYYSIFISKEPKLKSSKYAAMSFPRNGGFSSWMRKTGKETTANGLIEKR